MLIRNVFLLKDQIGLMGEQLDLKIQLAWWTAFENGDEAGMERAEKQVKVLFKTALTNMKMKSKLFRSQLMLMVN